MKTTHIKIIFDDRKLFGAIFCILIGFFLFGFFLSKDKVDSKSDLMEIKGVLQDFSFSEHDGFKGHTYSYFIYLQDYNAKFQIIPDFIDYFNKDHFEYILKTGDIIKLEISQNDFKRIYTNEKAVIFSISDNNITYLDSNDSIQKYNSLFPIYAGLLFIFVGLTIFYINREKLKK